MSGGGRRGWLVIVRLHGHEVTNQRAGYQLLVSCSFLVPGRFTRRILLYVHQEMMLGAKEKEHKMSEGSIALFFDEPSAFFEIIFWR